MFTLKLFGKRTTTIAQAEFFDFTEHQKSPSGPSIGATIVVRPKLLGRQEPGMGRAVEFHVGQPARPGTDAPTVCFVYNVEGYCIEKIGPFGPPPRAPKRPNKKAPAPKSKKK